MTTRYEIYPKIGVARLGNSPDEFYLGPTEIGGLPIECDENGNETLENGQPQPVTSFKDEVGRIKRQAQKFHIVEYVTAGGKETSQKISLDDDHIEKIEWTVHLANKKAVWFGFSELQGDLDFGPENTYENQHVQLRNPKIAQDKRQQLIIDPGPRSIDQPQAVVPISRYNIPKGYTHGSFPEIEPNQVPITSLGELRMDDKGNLIALGAFGNVTGTKKFDNFTGAPGYHDDISDGYVVATLYLKEGGTVETVPAWLIVGSPKYAPELANIVTLYDTIYDVAIRKQGINSEIYKATDDTAGHFSDGGQYTPLQGYQPSYCVDFNTHVKPLFDRMEAYRWVTDFAYNSNFIHPFDLSKQGTTEEEEKTLRAQRKRLFKLFRVPVLAEDYKTAINVERGPNQLFSGGVTKEGPDSYKANGIPLLPLNAGDNPVINEGPIYKFLTLTPTQYFFLHQWSEGNFKVDENASPLPYSSELATMGNSVGGPFSPGIESTWNMRSQYIYDAPFHLKLAHFKDGLEGLLQYYETNGLSTTANETYPVNFDPENYTQPHAEPGKKPLVGPGCEPGDLTKRMALPWQADFAQCTVQSPSLVDPKVSQVNGPVGYQVPPSYYVYWWPPQSPMNVITGSLDKGDQVIGAIVDPSQTSLILPAGQRVLFQRGVETVQEMVNVWSFLGFVVNQGEPGYPYFVETERNAIAFGQNFFSQLQNNEVVQPPQS